ncbi:MAG TPA: D-2-hydroxyacid dehydrogenase [Terracidiphilus sp.]|jgi:phosphoglycerate dehydrogenase-like enzyme|nr:D-2-hydroxyacid dehydrogenase [Terracidiphilus sp.]
MNKQPLVLAISDANDPQLAMLADIPHYLINSAATLQAAPRDAEVILHWSGPRDMVRSAFLASPNLRWLHSRSAGLDSMLFPELVQSPIPVTNGTGVFSQSLGEFALAVILYFAKDIRRLLRNQEACRWEQYDMEELPGQTVGIVAYGDIGRAVASRVHAMGMRVLALKRHAPSSPDPWIERFYGPHQLHAMLSECDYVVVAAPLTAETRHMIGDDAIAVMKPNAVVINVGRGPVIHQAALVRALAAGKIKGAGLDVFEHEPIPPDDPIFKLPNVLISPHTADHTKDWLNQAMRFFLEQYQRFSNGQPLENIVEKHLGY